MEGLLRRGLTDRATLVRAWASAAPAGAAQAAPPATLFVGLELHAENSLRLVDRGPAAADAAAVPAWSALWGERSQVRRFKDGAIVHSCERQESANT